MPIEHARIRTNEATVEGAVATLERLAHLGVVPDGIPDALRDLRAALEEHCRQMDAKGGFEQIVREDPRLSHDVDKLRAEHVAIRAIVGALIDDVGHAPTLHHPVILLALLERVHELVVAAERHHEHHSDVVHEAFVADTGALD
ncbi:MAG TPA: hypothetical protein VGB64_07275 [Actinomycetota bacterium]